VRGTRSRRAGAPAEAAPTRSTSRRSFEP